MTKDDVYKLICDANDADPANALIAIDKALAGKISFGELYAIVVKSADSPQNRRQDDPASKMPELSM